MPETRIIIDGSGEDWAGRPLLLDDPAGNGEPRILDLTTGYAFINQHALYLLVEADDPDAGFSEFYIDLQVGPNRLRVGWRPQWSQGYVADVTGQFQKLRYASRSEIAFGPALEARIDLRDLGSPDSVKLIGVGVWAGVCCEAGEWRIADRWEPSSSTPVVEEADPAWLRAPVGGALEAERLLSAPDTRAINLKYNAETRRALITGQAGAVPEGSSVIVGTTELNDWVMLNADSSGAFAAEVVAAPGIHVLVKQDVTGKMNPFMSVGNILAPGVMLRVPVEPADEGIAFGAGARMCCEKGMGAPWTIEGAFDLDTLSPGERFDISGRVAVLTDSPDLAPATRLQFSAYLIADAEGRQVGRSGKFITPFLTLTGLPVERSHGGPPMGQIWLGGALLNWELEDMRWVADFATTVRVPEDIRPGLYGLIAEGLKEVRDAAPDPAGLRTAENKVFDNNAFLANLGAITIGDTQPMRLTVTLLADQLSEGSRGGLISREDQGLFDLSPRAITRHEPVIPRLDGYGDAWTYRLEPYLPMLDAVDRTLPNSPSLLLDLTDSWLIVTVERPDGETDVLGPAPLTRYAVKSPRTPWHQGVGQGGGDLREIPQILGADDEFAYRFPLDGDYVITLDGHIAGIGGRKHLIQGTYDLTIANVLDIETALLPTTPFEVGDSMPVALTVMPQVPADIFYTVTQVGADGRHTSETFRGRANRDGWWDGDGAVWTFQGDGEYRVDVQACYADPQGSLWAGRLRFGGVVATPDAPIVAHGRRGADGVIEIPPAWAFERDYKYKEGIGGSHHHFPYFAGDILWGIDRLHFEREQNTNGGTSVISHMSFQSLDDNHPLIDRARQQAKQIYQIQPGQIPLVTRPEPRSKKSGAHPDEIDLWSYSYSSAERPGVRVREIIKGDDAGSTYWRFDDAYHMQSGNGREGDLPGDFKFLYGGAVIRDAVKGEGIYAIYGSAWVLLHDDDPIGSRVMPPFQGAAGGPDGGPLFTVHGREIDMFFMPLGVRPGAVLEMGDLFRMAGPVMPTLPSRIDYTVIAPNGELRTFGGRANAVGYFYDPDDDFALDQPGIWNVFLTVTHDGLTSAGPVESPFPTGGILSPTGTSFYFVVTDADTQRMEINTDLHSLTPAEWFDKDIKTANFEAALPEGWIGDQAWLTVTMPGTVLIDQPVSIEEGRIRWELDGEALNQIASNFDYEQGIADTVTVTFYAEGQLAGRPARAVGTIVTHGARVPVAPTGNP